MGDEFSHTMIHRPSPAIQIKGVVRDPKEILRQLKVITLKDFTNVHLILMILTSGCT